MEFSSMPLSVVILAAGQGKRMKSDLPKVLQPLAGRPMLEHVIRCARELEPATIHVVYGHGGDQVREALAGQPVNWILQEEQHGTGHAVMQAAPGIPDDHTLLVLYGDVPLTRAATLRALLERGPDRLSILSVRLADPTGYGRVLRDTAGKVYRIVEQRDANRKEQSIDEVNTGLMAAGAGLLKGWLSRLSNDNAQGEYYLTDVVALAVKDGVRVEAVLAPSTAEVLGVNDKLQLSQVEAEYRRLRAEALLLAGVTVIDPARLDLRGDVEHGRDVQLDVNVILEGRVKLGDRVRIGPNVLIRDCEIGAGSVINANCVLEQAVVGADCVIGPFARLRPGARLSAGVHIGNFCEIKNSEIGEGSKVNHLSYVGDSDVGSGVNVGAGTVTCNYDGANKHRTVIGDGAFIGSGAMLVAPVSVGEQATIGAGSTITKDAPAGKLTLERSKKVSLDGWKRPVKK
jgi:bifunctional UDP-N-acetylglucosamine pyrophosphorylase/glucosamine-1-phosphate N-acetyltransferase